MADPMTPERIAEIRREGVDAMTDELADEVERLAGVAELFRAVAHSAEQRASKVVQDDAYERGQAAGLRIVAAAIQLILDGATGKPPADILLDHIQQCHPEVGALLVAQSGSADDTVAEMIDNGWAVERTEHVAGKQIRIMRQDAPAAGFDRIAREIRDERARQDAKWGEQNHPDYDPHDIPAVLHHGYAFRAQRWKEINAKAATTGCEVKSRDPDATCTAWDGILLEEVYEALGEPDTAKRRTELVQTAAVAIAWIEAIDRRQPAEPEGADRG